MFAEPAANERIDRCDVRSGLVTPPAVPLAPPFPVNACPADRYAEWPGADMGVELGPAEARVREVPGTLS